MKKGQAAEKVDVDVTGVKTLVLVVENEGDNIDYDHADWADAKFEVNGEKPATIVRPARREGGADAEAAGDAAHQRPESLRRAARPSVPVSPFPPPASGRWSSPPTTCPPA